MGTDDPPTTPAAPGDDPEATTSLLDAAIAETAGESAPRGGEDEALRAFGSLQYILLDEIRDALSAVNASAEGILRTIFDPRRCQARSAELERLLVGKTEDGEPAATIPEDPPVQAPDAPAVESEKPLVATDADAGPPPSGLLAGLRTQAFGAFAWPLRLLAAPLASLPRPYRTLLGIFALTLFLWAPAVRWLATEAISRHRVRPLETAELDALSEALRPPVEAPAKPEGKSAKAKPPAGSGGH